MVGGDGTVRSPSAANTCLGLVTAAVGIPSHAGDPTPWAARTYAPVISALHGGAVPSASDPPVPASSQCPPVPLVSEAEVHRSLRACLASWFLSVACRCGLPGEKE